MHSVCALYEVSRHRTSEGLVSYHRCRCGRLDVRRSDVPVLSSAGDARRASQAGGRGPAAATCGRAPRAATGSRAPTAPTAGRPPTALMFGRTPDPATRGRAGGARVATALVVAVVAVLVLVAVLALPTPGLVGAVALGLFAGVLAGVGAGFVTADRGRGVRVGVDAAAVAVPAVLAAGGLLAVLGPVSVIALPVLYAVAGLAWWAGSRRHSGS